MERYNFREPFNKLRLELRFDESSGDLVRDYSGYGNHLRLVGTFDREVLGYISHGTMFDNTTASVIEHHKTIDVGKPNEYMCISGIIRIENLTGVGDVLHKGKTESSYPFYVHRNTSTLYLQMKSGATTIVKDFTIVPSSEWYMFRITRVLAELRFTVYILGILENGEMGIIKEETKIEPDTGLDFRNNAGISFGGAPNFEGYIDSFGIQAGTGLVDEDDNPIPVRKKPYDLDDDSFGVKETLFLYPLLWYAIVITGSVGSENIIEDNLGYDVEIMYYQDEVY